MAFGVAGVSRHGSERDEAYLHFVGTAIAGRSPVHPVPVELQALQEVVAR